MLLDIGFGIFFAIAVSRLTVLPLDVFTIVAAIVFSLLPDLDFLLHLSKRKKVDEFSHEHRDLFHNPLLFIPIGFLAIAFVSLGFAWLFLLCSLAHFLHDSVGMGWGVRWFYPVSKRYYKFFTDKTGRTSTNFLTSWTPEEQKQAVLRAAANSEGENWLIQYLKFSPEFCLELFVFAVAICSLFYFLSK